MNVAELKYGDGSFDRRSIPPSPPYLEPLGIEASQEEHDTENYEPSLEEHNSNSNHDVLPFPVNTHPTIERHSLDQNSKISQIEIACTDEGLPATTMVHGFDNLTEPPENNPTFDSQRRKRRKPIVPPQKFSISHLDTSLFESEMTDSDEEYSGDMTNNIKVRKQMGTADLLIVDNYEATEVETMTDVQLVDKPSKPKDKHFIQELSQQAVEAVRQSIRPTETTKPYDAHTELLLEKTLSKLEPQISRLVGQSLRSSIENIREQVLAGLKAATGITIKGATSNLDKTLTCSNKDGSTPPEDELSETKITMQNNTCSQKNRREMLLSTAKAPNNPSFTINNLNLSSPNERMEYFSENINKNMSRCESNKNEPPLSQKESISLKLNESVVNSSIPDVERNPISTEYTLQSVPYSNGFKLPFPQGSEHNALLLAAESLYAESKNVLGCPNTPSMNTTHLTSGHSKDGDNVERFGNGDATERLSNSASDKINAIASAQHSALHSESPAAVALAKAFELQTVLWMNKSGFNGKNFHNLPLNINQFFWSASNLSQFDLPAPTQFPLGLFPSLNGTQGSLPLSTSLPTVGSCNSSVQQSAHHGLTMDTHAEQTEAISLVVRRKNEEDYKTRPSNSSTILVPNKLSGMQDVLDSTTISPLAASFNGAPTFSRRRRTKVTDTRLSSRTNSRATFGYMQPRHMYPTTAAELMSGIQHFGTETRKAFENIGYENVKNIGQFPPNNCNVLFQPVGGSESERTQCLLSPPSSNDVRLNSSSSSPSPSSVRLSNGPTDLGSDGELNRGMLDKTRFPNSPPLRENRTPVTNLIPSPRLSDSHLLSGSQQQQFKARESFEQTLAKAFRTSPQAFKQRSINSFMNTLSDHAAAITAKQSLLNSTPFFNFSGCPIPFPAQLGSPGRDITEQHRVPPIHWDHGSSEEAPHFRSSSLSAFGRHVDNVCKRTMGESIVSCCEKEKLTGLDSSKLHHCVDGMRMTSTLTPVHLRKAKLMFFYTRYPNSTLIKMYFPDVKFYKNNTAQLVKWFSNFREFYYIQMEKFARVAISEGVRTADEIHVTNESEIYRALNLHYNRNQQLEVPDHFRVVVEATLREFFNALVTGKDTEQSWKKPIYKIIARMDQPVPEFFKNPNWMEQLADG